jgi:RNA polymerase sigma-70 factor (sigma-E family)
MRMSERSRAFEALCHDEYANLVRTAWLVVGDREEALDLAQEALVRAYERWRQVSAMERPGGWLQRVVVNLAISHRRRLATARRLAPASDEPVPPPEEPADPAITAALRSLTPAQRAVVVLRYLADQSVGEVAAALGKRPGTVRALTSQALARLREWLPDEEALR